MAELFQFQWEIPENGYRWIKSKQIGKSREKRSLFLVDRANLGLTFRGARYAPLQTHTGLFKTFADTEPTPENILRFANKHGPLGVTVNIAAPTGRVPWSGESLSTWTAEILHMRHAVELWALVRESNAKKLKQHITWHDGRVSYDSGRQPARGTPFFHHTDTITGTEVLSRFRRGDVVKPAWYFLQQIVKNCMKNTLSFEPLWDENQLGLYAVPHNLIGALWLQFGYAVVGKKDYPRCRQCQNWYESSRMNKHYCSRACRFKSYRQRQQRARELDAKGLSAAKIAKQLDSDTQTVKGWIESE